MWSRYFLSLVMNEHADEVLILFRHKVHPSEDRRPLSRRKLVPEQERERHRWVHDHLGATLKVAHKSHEQKKRPNPPPSATRV